MQANVSWLPGLRELSTRAEIVAAPYYYYYYFTYSVQPCQHNFLDLNEKWYYFGERHNYIDSISHCREGSRSRCNLNLHQHVPAEDSAYRRSRGAAAFWNVRTPHCIKLFKVCLSLLWVIRMCACKHKWSSLLSNQEDIGWVCRLSLYGGLCTPSVFSR